jgi:hypothetical protein
MLQLSSTENHNERFTATARAHTINRNGLDLDRNDAHPMQQSTDAADHGALKLVAFKRRIPMPTVVRFRTAVPTLRCNNKISELVVLKVFLLTINAIDSL